ncbi:choice-of-anchor A domain-containing protein/LPXTG-motif cell wall-anchored protein [Kutzneria viridogrisea]|uniref:Choice-of-anchor A domain-containing protein/LPXTG-motif cell wall-anchored protein n=1 Tax=Kutzneria viridogrisea TaxID=47990 RepID=A0ABR6BLE4_9PSEU|nr:choice-of-anchor A domain-containing protein/LPXTG-motif cell wall-anchored protein [Kutzneria viridogrisea]
MTSLRFAAAAATALLIAVAGSAPASATAGGEQCDSAGLGISAQFSAFVQHDATLLGTAAGRVAVGGNAVLGTPMGFPGLSVGGGAAVDAGRGDLLVGGKLDAHGVVLEKGGAFVGGLIGLATGIAAKVSGAAVATAGIGGKLDVDGSFAALTAKADAWAKVKVNGAVKLDGETLELSGSDSKQVVVGVTAAQLAVAKEIRIKAPVGATVLVNVAGEAYDAVAAGLRSVQVWDGHGWVGAGAKVGVVWNFAAAKKITLGGGLWVGTVLAPRAEVGFGLGIGLGVSGGLVASSVHTVVAVDLGVLVGFPACLPGGGGTGGGGGTTPGGSGDGGSGSTPGTPAANSSNAPSTSVSATPSSSAAPVPQAQATEPLAYTGANVVWIAVAAAVLLGLGAGALILSRRKRAKQNS